MSELALHNGFWGNAAYKMNGQLKHIYASPYTWMTARGRNKSLLEAI